MFLTPMKNVSLLLVVLMISVVLGLTACRVIVQHGKNFNLANVLDTINIINDKLCIMLLLTKLYPYTPVSMTLSVFQGHTIIRQF